MASYTEQTSNTTFNVGDKVTYIRVHGARVKGKIANVWSDGSYCVRVTSHKDAAYSYGMTFSTGHLWLFAR